MEVQTKTQKELLSDRLKEIKPNVTKADREAVHKDTKTSFSTISTYLSGNVRDLDTATTLIRAFEKLIDERAKKSRIPIFKKMIAAAV